MTEDSLGSAQPESAKPATRRQEPPDRRGAVPTRLAPLMHLLADGRPKPGPKEQEVLGVAAAYFLRHGYQGASINAMARESGISKESIYRYFSSKKQLFEAVIARELVDYRDSLRRLDAALTTIDLRDALLTIAETVLSVVTSDRTLALRRLIFEEATRSPDVGQHYFKIGPEQAFSTLENVFAAHAAQTSFDAQALARYFVAMTTYVIVLERNCAMSASLTKAEIKAAAAEIVDDFMRAFVRPG